MKTLEQTEAIKGGKLTKQELMLFDLFKEDNRYEFYKDYNGSLAARLINSDNVMYGS